MSEINDGGAAFPGMQCTEGHGEYIPAMMPNGDSAWIKIAPGMSLRDWFAGMALQGICQSSQSAQYDTQKDYWFNASKRAYGYADAMLAARES